MSPGARPCPSSRASRMKPACHKAAAWHHRNPVLLQPSQSFDACQQNHIPMLSGCRHSLLQALAQLQWSSPLCWPIDLVHELWFISKSKESLYPGRKDSERLQGVEVVQVVSLRVILCRHVRMCSNSSTLSRLRLEVRYCSCLVLWCLSWWA